MMRADMSAPLKNVTTEDLEKALAAALLAVSGRTVTISVGAMNFDEGTSRVDIAFRAWDKLSTDPFASAI